MAADLARACQVRYSKGTLFLEGTLLEKLRKIEALHAGTNVDGEREAARRAAERIRERLAEIRGRETDTVLLYRLPDPWTRRLFLALCRRYGLKPYREAGRRHSTVMVRAPETFQNWNLPRDSAQQPQIIRQIGLAAHSLSHVTEHPAS